MKKRSPKSIVPHRLGRSYLICGLLFFRALVFENFAEVLVLHLKNGDRITGQLVTESTTNLVLRSSLFGEVTVPIGEIERRQKTLPEIVNLIGTTNPPPPMVAIPPVTEIHHSNTVAVVPVLRPASPAPKPATPSNWHNELQVGMNLRYNITDSQEYLTSLKTTYSSGRLRETLDGYYVYGKTEGILSANRLSASTKTDYDLTKRLYLYHLGGGGFDEIRKIDLQYDLGPGVGYRLVNWEKQKLVLTVESGFNFQEQYRSDGTTQLTYSARFAELLSWNVWGKLIAEAKAEYFSNLESFGNYRLRMEGTLRYPLTKVVSLNLNLIDLYDTLPANGVHANDLQIRSALGLKF